MWHSAESLFTEDHPLGIWSRADVDDQLRNRAVAVMEGERPLAPAIDRNDRIRWYRDQGWKLQEIADEFGITKQRVDQICKHGRGQKLDRVHTEARVTDP